MLVETDNAPRRASEPQLDHRHHMKIVDGEGITGSSGGQQVKSLSNSPTESPFKKRPSDTRGGDWTMYSIIQELDKER